MEPNPPNRPPDAIHVARSMVYHGASLFETLQDMYSGSDNEVVGVPDVINLAIDYALEDMNNPRFGFDVTAIWTDEDKRTIYSVVYDNNGNPIEWTVSDES